MPLSRRDFLGAGVAATSLALAGCSSAAPVTGSFLQPWRSHLQMPRDHWRQRLADTHALGCRELFVQWTGILGETQADSWMLADAQIADLLDIAAELGMGVHLGLPYDERWWKQIHHGNAGGPGPFLAHIADIGQRYMQTAPWPRHAAFRGWYIPYELEQYHWDGAERVTLLVQSLQALARTAEATSQRTATVSTYFSRLQTQGSLATLWSILLDQMPLHPMLQDGVGVAGMQNYEGLAPLRQMLLHREAPFDLIVELFEQLPPTQPDGSDFRARSATFERVRQQWDIARDYGAERIVAFAIDPWVLDDTPEARALRRQWKSAVR
jgi:sugar phosphate isomerase/epimerase